MAKKKKGKDPAFLMYSGDFLSGTFTMNYEQRGKYITLMCIQHQKGYLTDADMKSVLNEEDYLLAEKFYKGTDGNWYNQKMTDVMQERKSYTEERLSHFNKNKDKDTDKGNDKNNDMKTHKNSHMEHHTGNEDEDENQDRNQVEIQNEFQDRNEVDNEYVVGSEEAELEEYYQEAYNQELEREYSKDYRQETLAATMATTWEQLTKKI
jgi:hypothetical protein